MRELFINDHGKKVEVKPVTPVTLLDKNNNVAGLALPDGTLISPALTNVTKIMEAWDNFEQKELEVIWDGAAPERYTHGTTGHSKGLLLDNYEPRIEFKTKQDMRPRLVKKKS
jgi:hypothetical protein